MLIGDLDAFALGFEIWDLGLELCVGEFVVRAWAFGNQSFQECQKNKTKWGGRRLWE